MQNGWIKLHRRLLDSIVFKNEKCLKIWVWCLLRANHQEKTIMLGREKVIIKAGQFVMGLNKSSEILDLAKSTIHYWLSLLEKEGKVELKKTNKYTIITIKNWDDFQDVELKKNSNGTLKETNKNDKKDKNITTEVVRVKTQPREDINTLLDKLNKLLGMLDGSQKEHRFYGKLFLDSKSPEILRRAGNLNPSKDQIINATLRIFQLALEDNFHCKNARSMKYVYGKAASIVASKFSNQSKVTIIS